MEGGGRGRGEGAWPKKLLEGGGGMGRSEEM